MNWYERIIFEIGFWIMTNSPAFGLYLCQTMMNRSHKRNQKASEAGPYEF